MAHWTETSVGRVAMGEAEEPGWYMSEYVELAPGTEVYVTDRDHPAWDSAGLIKKAPRRGSGRTFVVGFDGASDLSLGIDQIAPTVEEWKKPEALARRRLHQMRVFLCHGSEDKA